MKTEERLEILESAISTLLPPSSGIDMEFIRMVEAGDKAGLREWRKKKTLAAKLSTASLSSRHVQPH